MIRFENVSFHYGGEYGTGEGVDSLNFEIKEGEFIVLCGRSGCGKTTDKGMKKYNITHACND